MLGFFGTDIHVEAAEVGKKFKNLFMLYSKFHHAINKAERITDQEIIELSMLNIVLSPFALVCYHVETTLKRIIQLCWHGFKNSKNKCYL